MDKTAAELSQYRYKQAQQCIKSAKLLVTAEDYKGAANRSYYAIFHAMRAANIVKGFGFSKHSGVIAFFNKDDGLTFRLEKKLCFTTYRKPQA